jgi:hypothetical protein
LTSPSTSISSSTSSSSSDYRIVLFGLIIGLYLPECPSKYGWDDWFAERDMQVPLNRRPATADEYPWLKIVRVFTPEENVVLSRLKAESALYYRYVSCIR